jgi:2'-5' RNA ligase
VDPHAGVPGHRLFVAVPLPETAAQAVADIVEGVRSQPLPTGAHDVRWVRLDSLHLTLRFLGPTPDPMIDVTRTAVERAAALASGPIAAALGGAGTFPPTGRPRTLWIGMSAGEDDLSQLAQAVGRELVAAGWPPDDRPFRAHLTLARSDGIGVGRLVADRLVSAMTGQRIDCHIDRVGLFESITGGGPARYERWYEYPLGGPDAA